MAKRKKKRKYKMPLRLWRARLPGFNWQQKHFLAFIWSCTPRGCHCWNCRLAKRYHVTPRTIQRWISNLHDLELISIGHPDGPGRTLWPRYQALNTKTEPDRSHIKTTPEQTKKFLDATKRRRKAIAAKAGPPPKWRPELTNQAQPATL